MKMFQKNNRHRRIETCDEDREQEIEIENKNKIKDQSSY